MRRFYALVAGIVVLGTLAASIRPGWSQYREYYILGTVVDTQKKPLAGVEISLRDEATSRSYNIKTKKDGTFRFVGLPHGVYQVVFEKPGFAVKVDTWRFEAPQDSMLKVEIPPVVMASAEVVSEAERIRAAAAGVKDAAEKVRLGDFDQALAALGPILERNPDDSNALYVQGLAYQKKGMWQEAVDSFLRVAGISPKFAAVHYQLGICYQQLGVPDRALASYEETMALDPANPDAAYNAGLIRFEQSRVDEALGLFEKALSLKPDDPAYLEMAGRCHINKAEFAKAITLLERAKELYASNPDRVKFLQDLITMVKEQIKK